MPAWRLKSAFAIIIAILALALPAAHAQTSITVPNASFETPVLTGGTFQAGPTGGNWTFTGAGIASNGSGFTSNNANAPAGSQVAYIQGTSYFSQAISGFTSGTSYTITFAAANRAGYGAQTYSVKVDGNVIKSFDPGSSATTYTDYSASFTATAASHTISFVGTALYAGDVTVFIDNVRIVSAGSGGTGLKGDYFTNTTLTGAAALTRTDAGVNFVWNGVSPGTGIGGTNFSARWCGQVQPQYSETYTFYTMSDDGVRLWVNGTQLINDWNDHGAIQDAGSITLSAGQKYDIVMEYYQGAGGSQATLSWSSPSRAKEVIPSSRLYPAVNGLNGDYYNTWDLSGAIIATRIDPVVDFDWLGGAPIAGLNTNSVSIRWTGQVKAQYSETYTFYTNTDDGARLWVNGVQLVNDYTGHATTENSGTITLIAGQKYDLKFEYYQGGGGDVAQLKWSSPSTTKAIIPQNALFPTVSGTGLKGEYFSNNALTGSPVITRTESTVNFDWGSGSPDASIPADNFSARWSGQVKASSSDTYTFYTTSDDGVRLWVNGVQLINNWGGHAPTDDQSTITLVAGQKYDIKMEYFELSGGAVAQLYWSNSSFQKAIIPQTSLYPTMSGTVSGGPNAPSALTSYSVWNNRADLAWTDNSTDETGFKLERKTGVDGTWAQIALIAASWTSCIDNTVSAGTLYVYRMRATNANGDSAYSNETTVTTTGTSVGTPTAPSSLSAVATAYNRVDFGWTDNSTNETGFRLERKTGAGGTYAVVQNVPSNWTSTWDGGASASTTYYYRLLATNAAGDSAYSNEVSVTTPAGPATTPAAPSSLTASSVNPNRVDLGWLDNSNNETGFKLERKTGAGGTYAQIALISANWTSCMDNTAVSGTLYYYRMRATNASGDSSYSNEASVTVYGGGTPPSAPGTITATASSSSRITASWANVASETGYKLERKTGAGGTYAQITTTGVDVVSYVDDGLAASTQYYYRVRATNDYGDSTYSSEANATTQAAPTLAAPSGLGATATSSSQINLAWTDNSSTETGFKIERKLGAGGTYAQITQTAANAISYPDTGLAASTQYYYRVRATTGATDSAYSSEAFATTQPSSGLTLGIQAVSANNVKLSDPFWAPRIETNRQTTIQRVYQNLYNGDHSPQNFYNTWSGQGWHDSFAWVDSDVYKNLEGMALAIKLHEAQYGNDGKDNELRGTLGGMVTDIVKAQQAGGDGYLDTYVQLGVQGRGNGGSYTAGRWEGAIFTHEDYCMGHMMELALAHYALSNNTDATMLNAAKWNADYLKNNIPANYNVIPGHQEVELALMRLYESQGRPNDLAQAKYYLDERGRHSNGRTNWGEFCQDIYQIRNVYSPDAHVVRGVYMWDGATRVAVATSDTTLLNNMTTMWSNVVNKKMFATGSMGMFQYNEGFGPDYDLENLAGYNETCGSCAMTFWSASLVNMFGDGKYSDMVERQLYNAFASGRSLDGTRVYYNDYISRYGAGPRGREGIPCCATNIVRTVPRIPGYQYGVKSGDGVWAHLYMAGDASMSFGSTNVSLQQQTTYPWDGAITIKVTALSGPAAFNVHVRIPGWASGVTGDVNGSGVTLTPSNGYATINRTWAVNDQIHLNIPMPVRRISMPNVPASAGKVAIARGPIVYCLESTDNGTNVHNIVIPSGNTINIGAYNGGDLGGIVRLSGSGIDASNGGGCSYTMIPYALFDNRNGFNYNTDLEVMIPQLQVDAVIKRSRFQEQYATVSASYFNNNGWENLGVLNDGIIPISSDLNNSTGPNSIVRCTFYGHNGTSEWFQYDFSGNRTFTRSDMLWYSDDGGVQLPQSATLQYWNGSSWVNVTLDAAYPSDAAVGSGQFNVLRFNSVSTNKLRLNVQLKAGVSAGILEWRLP